MTYSLLIYVSSLILFYQNSLYTSCVIKGEMMRKQKPGLLTLLLLISMAATASVLSTPALPEMMVYFSVGAHTIKNFVTIFMLAYAISPLLYGPITHRFGRKNTIYAGIAVGMLGSVISLLAWPCHSLVLLLVGRFIQGLGTGVGLVLAVTMINDVYDGVKARRVTSYATLSFAILPGLSIFLGGYLAHYFNWTSGFYCWLIYSVLILLLVMRLPETSDVLDKNALQFKKMLLRYVDAMCDKRVVAYSMLWGSSTSLIYLFSADMPIVVIKQLGFSPAAFGIINVTTYISFFMGNLLSSKLAPFVSARKLMILGVSISFIAGIALSFCYHWNYFTIWTLYGLSFFIFFGFPFTFSNAAPLAAAHLKNRVTASAVTSFINMGMAVVVMFVSGLFTFSIMNVLSTIVVVLMFTALCILFLTRNLR